MKGTLYLELDLFESWMDLKFAIRAVQSVL